MLDQLSVDTNILHNIRQTNSTLFFLQIKQEIPNLCRTMIFEIFDIKPKMSENRNDRYYCAPHCNNFQNFSLKSGKSKRLKVWNESPIIKESYRQRIKMYKTCVSTKDCKLVIELQRFRTL